MRLDNMKRKTVILLALIPVMAAAGVLHSNWFLGKAHDPTAVSYSTVPAERRVVGQSVLATGIIKPMTGAEVKVGAQVSGIVQKLHVEIGTRVKKGELLAEIEETGYKAKADLALAQKGMAETEKKFAELELQRYRALLEQRCVSTQQMESIEKAFELASSRLQQAEADLVYALLQLSYTKVRSPIDGTIASVATQEGETVTASFSAPTFVTIIDLNRLELWAYVDETDIGRVRKGQSASFSVDTYPGEEFLGVVQAIYPKAEIQNNVVNYVAVIRFDQRPERIVRPEMTANLRIYGGKAERVLVVPLTALRRDGNRSYVYLLADGVPAKRYVETGASDKKFAEVRSGLSGNDQVIVGEIHDQNNSESGDGK
jgi:RND family efflux transporter MFP subunit